jgi:hypothetical protein
MRCEECQRTYLEIYSSSLNKNLAFVNVLYMAKYIRRNSLNRRSILVDIFSNLRGKFMVAVGTSAHTFIK